MKTTLLALSLLLSAPVAQDRHDWIVWGQAWRDWGVRQWPKLQQEWEDRHLPQLSDLERWSYPLDYVLSQITLGGMIESSLADSLQLANDQEEPQITANLQEVRRRLEIYRNLAFARDPYYYTRFRRCCLRDLRDLLGPVDYWRGVLPPIVPIEMFRVVR